MGHPDSDRFAEAAVREGLLARDALERLAREDPRFEPDRFLGFALLDAGALTEESFCKALDAAKLQVLSCVPCGSRQVIREWDPDRLYLCPACAGVLAVFRAAGKGGGSSATIQIPAAPLDDLLGEEIGGCQVQSRLGAGGMGVVYRALHRTLNKPVAVKILSPNLVVDPTQIQRFVREAQSTAQLEHPNVVQVLNVGKRGPYHFIVMQFVDGSSVRDLLKRDSRIEARQACRIVLEAARGLHAAHRIGIIHRDVKPDNLLLTKEGQVKVTDFGLAKIQRMDQSLSQTGMVLGTPTYMSPEQASGVPLDPRTDVYSLGATFYHLVAGMPPFSGETPLSVILKHVQEEPRDPREIAPDVPPVVSAVIGRMIAKDREARYPDMEAVARDLEAILRHPSWPPPPSVLARAAAPVAPPSRLPAVPLKASLVAAGIAALLVLAALLRPSVGGSGGGGGTPRPPVGGKRPPAVPEEPPPVPSRDPLEGVRAEAERLRAAGRFRLAIKAVDDFLSGPGAEGRRGEAAALRDGILGQARQAGERAVQEGDRLRASGRVAEARAAYEQAISLDLPAERFHKRAQERLKGMEAPPSFLAELEALLAAGNADETLRRLDALPPSLPEADRAAAAWLKERAANRRDGMVFVPEGEFVRGNDRGYGNERPQQRLRLPGFFIDRTEVSNREYRRYVDASGAKTPPGWPGGKPPPGREEWPATGVAWAEAGAYAAWARKRLPTEEEWEKAARGDSGRLYPWGDAFDPARVNSASGGKRQPEPVGSRPEGASPYGCLHMSGNAWEWTASAYGPYPGSTDRDPFYRKGYRSVRGGDFRELSETVRTTTRKGVSADYAGPDVGFRCVRDVAP